MKLPLQSVYRAVLGESATFNERWALYKSGVIEKKSLPSVVVGGTCDVGMRCLINNMIPTGFMAFDVDEGEFDVDLVHAEFITSRDDLFDPVLSFRSPSGALKWIIYPKYIMVDFTDSHKLYTRYLVNKFGWPVAPRAQSNINRKTFLSLDPKVWVNKTFTYEVCQS